VARVFNVCSDLKAKDYQANGCFPDVAKNQIARIFSVHSMQSAVHMELPLLIQFYLLCEMPLDLLCCSVAKGFDMAEK
jgi:hypothetical protein